jgi:predicted nucleotidyltransferase
MIKFEKLPVNILSRIPGVREVPSADSRVLFAYLFGGLATGRANPLSDVDIAVYLNETGGLAEYKLALFGRITDALGTSELDLVVLNTALRSALRAGYSRTGSCSQIRTHSDDTPTNR